ncbi:MAG: alpha/beta fold hydrolase [Solirubrobacterales bacterium]
MSKPGGRAITAAAAAAAAAGSAAWLASRARRKGPVELPVSVDGGRERTVTSLDGTRIHVVEYGPEEGPALVLVHAWMCSIELWHRQIEALDTEARIIALDLRGHGRSGLAPTLDYSIEAFADDLNAVLEACLGDGERAVLAGHSMGAMTVGAWALRYAEQIPRRCAAVAMIGTGLGDLTTESLVVNAPIPFTGAKKRIEVALLSTEIPFDGAPEAAVRAGARYLAFGPEARDEDVALVAAMVRNCPRRVRGLCGGTLSRMDVYEGLSNLDVPASVIAGARDRMTPPVHSDKLAELLPAAPKVIVAPGAGHMVPLEAEETVTSELRKLLPERAGRKRRRLPKAAKR